MFELSRQDQETAAIIDRAVQLYETAGSQAALALLAEHRLPSSMIERVLRAPNRRRGEHAQSPPAQP